MAFGTGGFEEVGVRAVVDGFAPYMGKLGAMEKKTQSFGSRVGSALRKGSLVGGAAVVALGAISVKAFAGFDSAMTKSLAIMGDVSDEMRGKMSKAARDVAKTTTFSAEQAADSYFFLASAGLDAAASIKAMPKVAAFAQAGMFDMARATDLATDAQSALGLTIRDDAVKNVKNLVRVTDVLVKANTLANATVEQFSTSLTTKAGAAMKALGIDMEEGVAVLAAFADQGIKGQLAGEKFSIVLRDLQKASIENREAFEGLGISVFDANGEVRNMGVIVGELEAALGPMSDEQKKVTLGMLGFQEESQAALITLLGTSDAIVRYEKELRNAAGTTDEIAKKQLQTFSAQLTLMWHKIQDVFIIIGSKLVPILLILMQVLENNIVPAVKDVIAVIADVVGWLGRNKEAVGILAGLVLLTLVPAIVAWTQAAWANVTAQAAQAAAMVLANPALLALVAGVGLLGAAYLATDKQGQKMALGFLQKIGLMEARVFKAVLGPFGIDPLFGRIIRRMEEAGQAIDEFNEMQDKAARGSAKWAEQTIADLQAMTSEGEELGLTIEQIELAQLEKLAQELAGVGRLITDQEIGPIWSAAMEEVMTSTSLTADEIDGLIDRAVELSGASEEGGEAIRTQLTAAIEDMHLPAKEAKEDLLELTDAVEEIPEPVDEAGEAFEEFRDQVGASMEAVGDAIESLLPTIDEEFSAWQERLSETALAYTNFQTNLETILGSLVAAHVAQPELIIQALSSAGPGVTQAMATHLAENPVAAVEGVLADLETVVGTNIQGATDAVLKQTPAFQAEMSAMAAGAVEAVDETLMTLAPNLQTDLGEMNMTVATFLPTFKEEMRRLAFEAMRSFRESFWRHEGETLADWIARVFGEAYHAAQAALKVSSPSKVFMDLGKNIRLGLERGMQGIETSVVASVTPRQDGVAPSPAAVVHDVVRAPQAVPTTPGLDRLADLLGGQSGGMSVSVTAVSQEQVAEEVGRALRGMAFEMGRAGA